MAYRARRKYHNQPVLLDGSRFDSKREARRWSELQLMERAGLIRDLRRQVRYPLDVAGVHVCDYVADFVYVDLQRGEQIVEDAKGFRTKEYRLKRKLLLACHGIDIAET